MDPIRIEAENFATKNGYINEPASGTANFASNGRYIGLNSSLTDGQTGTASTTFTGATGKYRVILTYFDESDAVGQLGVSIGGSPIANITMNRAAAPNEQNGGVPSQASRVTRTIVDGLDITQGSNILITGTVDRNNTGGEFARVDYIEFVRVDGNVPGPDTTAPVVTVDTLSTTDTTPALTGTVDDPAATIRITLNGADFTATNNGDGTWTLANDTITPALAVGTYDVLATATDAASNAGTDNSTNELTITDGGTTPPPPTGGTGTPSQPAPNIDFGFDEGNRGDNTNGDSQDNVIRGGSNNDVIQGRGGDDRLVGLAGQDRLLGGAGDDTMVGSAGDDRLIGGAGNDTALGYGGNDKLSGAAGDDTLRGGGGRDLLQGRAGDDTLLGGGGDDIIVGGAGADTLTGNRGKDVFKFNSLAEAVDQITDFTVADDLLDVRTLFAASQFGTADASTKFNQFVKLTQIGANTEVQIDADGTGVGTTFTTLVTLNNVASNTVSASNFVI